MATPQRPEKLPAKPEVVNPQIPEGEAPAPKPTPSHDKQWKCEIQPRAEGEITVGTKLAMLCEGEPVDLKKDELRIEPRPEQKYTLRLLEVKSLTETKAELIVTSWAAGEHDVENPALTDGNVRVGLGDQKIVVATVINPQENPEGKPYGPLAPMTLSWPIWLWLVIAAIAGLISLALWIPVRRSMKRKKLLQLLEKNQIAMSPFNHFNKELRRLLRLVPTGRSNEPWHEGDARAFFQELETAFRWYLARELRIPAIEGSASSVVDSLKRVDKSIWSETRKDMRLVLDELAKAKVGRPAVEDAAQLSELCRSLADKISKTKGDR